MKMVFYLLCQFIELFEADAVHMDSAAAAVGAKGKKGKKAMPRSDHKLNLFCNPCVL